MEIIINRKSIQPIYEQVVEQIKEHVSSGELMPGDRISSVRVLAKDLKIGTLTVQKAYDILQREGIIESIVGKGTIISQKSVSEIEASKKDLIIQQSIRELVSLAAKHQVTKEELIHYIDDFYE